MMLIQASGLTIIILLAMSAQHMVTNWYIGKVRDQILEAIRKEEQRND